ncbi:MAG: hypothetical protein E7333_04260 [Clostridiales bacterium]|nr:hypothetical protein [Clostridiales bacterium]
MKHTETKSLLMLLAVMLLGAVLVTGLLASQDSLRREIVTLQDELTRAETQLKEVITQKEERETQLKTIKNDIREADLTIEESTAKIADLEEDIAEEQAQKETHQQLIDELTLQLEGASGGKSE